MQKKKVPIEVGEGPGAWKPQAASAILLSITSKRHQRELRKVGKATLNHNSES